MSSLHARIIRDMQELVSYCPGDKIQLRKENYVRLLNELSYAYKQGTCEEWSKGYTEGREDGWNDALSAEADNV